MNQQIRQTFSFKGDGGTLDVDAPSYIERKADIDLFNYVSRGQFCHVFAPRQMGKSSLMTHTIKLLDKGNATNIHPIFIDLSTYGETDIEQWYSSIMRDIGRQLGAEIALDKNLSLNLTPGHRLKTFLETLVNTDPTSTIVIFLDEVDATLSLPFADDFFSTIQAIFNARGHNKNLKQLVFVLLGVVTTRQLIQDRNREYNIGQKIDLHEFTWQETGILRRGMEKFYPNQADKILYRVLYWTNGHPFLTQKLCDVIAGEATEHRDRIWSNLDIDRLVNRLFLQPGVRSENLSGVDKVVSEQASLLTLYKQVREGRKIKDDDTDDIQNRLKLYGLVRPELGTLEVHNRIYERVFNVDWVEENLGRLSGRPGNRVLIASLIVLLIMASLLWLGLRFNRDPVTPETVIVAAVLTETPPQPSTATPTTTPTPNEQATFEAVLIALQTAQPTDTPLPTATDTTTPTPTVFSTPTNTATATPTQPTVNTPSPEPEVSSPLQRPEGDFLLLGPTDDTEPSNGKTTFEWEWVGSMSQQHGFEVRVWKEGEAQQGVHESALGIYDTGSVPAGLEVVERLGEGKYRLAVDISNAPGVNGRSGQYLWNVRLVEIEPGYKDLALESLPMSFQVNLDSGGNTQQSEGFSPPGR